MMQPTPRGLVDAGSLGICRYDIYILFAEYSGHRLILERACMTIANLNLLSRITI